jgi:2-haloacid dehalogenase
VELNLAWHRIDAWQDVAPGLARLKKKFWLAPVSNGNISMMVAAHSYDLSAAAALGLRTAHIARPNEAGPGKGERSPKIEVDVAGSSLEDVAAQLGA